jgi:hypothetical protein
MPTTSNARGYIQAENYFNGIASIGASVDNNTTSNSWYVAIWLITNGQLDQILNEYTLPAGQSVGLAVDYQVSVAGTYTFRLRVRRADQVAVIPTNWPGDLDVSVFVSANPPPTPSMPSISISNTTTTGFRATASVSGETVNGIVLRSFNQNGVQLQAFEVSNGGSADFSGLSPGTSYSVTAQAFVNNLYGTSFSQTNSRSVTTTQNNPVWSTSNYTGPAKIGVAYSSQVTATNAVSYEVTSGSLPNGLSLNSSNGTISGTPTQKTSGSFFSEANGYLDTFTFTVRANGASGSTPASKQFTINTIFPGRRRNSANQWVNQIIARRFENNAWVPIQTISKRAATTWTTVITP